MSAGATERARKAAPLPQRRRALEQRARRGVSGPEGVEDESDPTIFIEFESFRVDQQSSCGLSDMIRTEAYRQRTANIGFFNFSTVGVSVAK